MKFRTIYHVELAKTGTGLSGGEVCMLEMVNIYSRLKIKNVIVTTDNGKEAYSRYLGNIDYVEYVILNSYSHELKYGVFVSYLMRTKKVKKMVQNLDVDDRSLLICHSEFLPNSIFSKYFAALNKDTKLAYFFHMKSPSVLRGYEGEFTKKIQIPRATIIHYKLTQFIYRLVTPKSATIFTVNDYYYNFLSEKYTNRIVVLDSYGQGRITKATDKKEYDLLWVGRFHRQKGLLDLPKIVSKLTIKLPNIRVAVIGDGDKKIRRKLINSINELGLEDNIECLGFLTGVEKDSYYDRSKIFLMTSYYESFGQVLLEAMGHGLSVVGYRLPVYDVFNNTIVSSPLGDIEAISKNIETLLIDDSYVNRRKLAFDEASKHSWKSTALKILDNA